jgi:predicted ABC-type ATPase
VAEHVVRRRFGRSLANLPAYLSIVDLWRVYEASGPAPVLALEGHGAAVTYRDADVLRAANSGVAATATLLGR